MESECQRSSEKDPPCQQGASPDFGCRTPPPRRGQATFSALFHQPKVLTSAELKRRFPRLPLSTKKRRVHLIQSSDCLVPTERNLNTPVILTTLFERTAEFSPGVRRFASSCALTAGKAVHPRPNFDSHIARSLKSDQENLFSISESIMKQKWQVLLRQQK